MQKNNFLLLNKLKNTENAQLCQPLLWKQLLYIMEPLLSPIKERSSRAKCDTLSVNSLFKFFWPSLKMI